MLCNTFEVRVSDIIKNNNKQALEYLEAINNGNKHILLISYTNEGVKSLENEYRKQNDGVLDNGVIIKTWYSFLLSEFIKPYQCSLSLYYKYYNLTFPFI